MPTGLFDDLIETDEPRPQAGMFDDLIDQDEGTTASGKFYPAAERKGVTYDGHYYPSLFEMEKEKEGQLRKPAPKGVFQRFREGLTAGTGGAAGAGAFALTRSDDQLKNLLLSEQDRLKASDEEPTLSEKAAEVAGRLLGTGVSAVASQVVGGKPAMSAMMGVQSAGDSFLKGGLRALAEGKTPEEAVKIARRVAIAGAGIGAAEGAIVPTGGLGSAREIARAAGVSGGLFGAGQTARNVAERAAGLRTPIMEGVPQAVGLGAALPVAFGGVGLLLRPRPVPPPVPSPEPQPVPLAPFMPPPQVEPSKELLKGLSPKDRTEIIKRIKALAKGPPVPVPVPEPLIQPEVSGGVPPLPRGDPSGLDVVRPDIPTPSRGPIKATPELLEQLPPGRLETSPLDELLRKPLERGPALELVEELGQSIRRRTDFEKSRSETVSQQHEAIVHPNKPLTDNQIGLIEDSLKKAILENQIPGERPGFIAGTALEKWADDVMNDPSFRGRLSINPVDLLAKEIPALAIKGAAVLERGVRDFQAWSAEMLKLYGDEFKPILRKVYIQSLQVKGGPSALQRESAQVLKPVPTQPIEGQRQVPVQERLGEAVPRGEPAVQPREAGQAQVPLTGSPSTSVQEILQKPVQEVAANYESLLGDIAGYGVEKFNRDLAAMVKTPEDLAALKAMAESFNAKVNQLKKEDFPEAVKLAGFQPMEAYKFAEQNLTKGGGPEAVIPPATGVDATPAIDAIKQELGLNDSEIAALVKAKDLIGRRSVLEDALRRVGIRKRKQQSGPHNEAVESAVDEALNAIVERLPIDDARIELGSASPRNRGIAASARDALAEGGVPRGTEAGFIRPGVAFQRAVESFAVNDPAAPPVVIDRTGVVPRLQPWEADKLISSSPEGIGRIPGIGRLFDPRASAFSEVDRAIVTNAKERGVGETIAALWGQSNRVSPFVADADGSIAMAGGIRGHMSDAIEAEMRNPGSQPMTPEQRAWVTDVWAPLHRDVTEMLQAEGVKGFDLAEGERSGPGYFPRIAIGKRDTSTGPSQPRGGSGVGGRQFFQKERLYDSEAQGSGTTIYEPDATKRVSSYISRAYKAIADHRLSKDESLGSRELSLGPPLFQKEGQVFQPAFSGRVFSKETADRLNKFYGESAHDWVRKLAVLNDAAKAWKLTLDLSAPLTQGLPVLFNRPAAWARATGNSFRAMLDPGHMAAVLNRPEMKEAASELAQLGVRLGKLQDFMAGAEKGALITKIPVAGKAVEATGRSFGAFMDLAKIEMWRGIRDITPQDQWPKMAELVENLTGSGRMESIGISPGRALGERMLFLAPTYYRAGVSLVATALQGGAAGSAARAALARFGTGVALTSVAGMMAAGLSWEEIQSRLNPANGKFLKVPVKIGERRTEVGFGHLLISLSRLAGDTIEEVQSDKPAGTGVEKEPWKRWLRTHSGPVPSALFDMTTGTGVMGEEVGTARTVAQQFVPITIQQAITGEGTAEQRAFDASMAFFGMSAFPQSVREQFSNERDAKAKEKFGKAYESLSLVQQANIHKSLKDDKRFEQPPASARVREMAFENDVARQNRLMATLPTETQKQITDLGLHITGHEPRISVGGTRVGNRIVGATDLPLTRKQAEAYEKLIANEYGTAIKTVPWTNWANLNPARRQVLLNERLAAAKTRARTKFKEQAGK